MYKSQGRGNNPRGATLFRVKRLSDCFRESRAVLSNRGVFILAGWKDGSQRLAILSASPYRITLPLKTDIKIVETNLLALYSKGIPLSRQSGKNIGLLSRPLRIDNIPPVKVSPFQSMDQHFRCGQIGCIRNIMHIAQPEHALFIDLTSPRCQGITEKDEQVNLIAGNPGSNLLITAMAAS